MDMDGRILQMESTDASKLVHSAYVVKEYHQGGQTFYQSALKPYLESGGL